MKRATRILALVLAVSCSDDDSDGGSAVSGATDLSEPGLYVSAKVNGPAGQVAVDARGALTLGAVAAPDAPAVPSGRALSDADLAADVGGSGTLVLGGALRTSGAGGLRTITSSDGDIVLSGTLTAVAQGVTLNAPAGTVHLLGSLRAEGAVTVAARRIVLSGLVDASGPSGWGVRLAATGEGVLLRGGVVMTDGKEDGGGTIRVEGNRIEGPAILSARGAPGGTISMAGGDVRLGARRVEAVGGADGDGGGMDFYTSGGEITIEALLDASGGHGAARAGAGGAVTILADVGGGSVGVTGTIVARGGSASNPAASLNGGHGGTARLVAYHPAGELRLRDSAVVDLDGGSSTGAGIAGGGGTVFLETSDGLVSISGRMWLRGGAALGTGGTGGLGGRLEVVSDVNQNGVGPITIEPAGVVDASGGPGTIGGHARHDLTDTATNFPREVSAVSLDSDTAAQSGLGGVIQNLGLIVARGGAPDGWGGDVFFHGFGAPPHREPQSGNLDLAGAGPGRPGNFLGD